MPLKPIAFAQRLHGRLTVVGPGLADIESVAEGDTPLGASPTFATQLVFGSERSFEGAGTVSFADGETALRCTTLGAGDLVQSPDRTLRHGTATFDVWGLGPLSGARGRITTNFVVADDGSVTDEQTVVLFTPPDGGSA